MLKKVAAPHAAALGMAGFMKTTAHIELLAEKGMSFVISHNVSTVRLFGILELLGATGLSIVMLLATQYHLSPNESPASSKILLLLTAFVAWGRFVKAPVRPK